MNDLISVNEARTRILSGLSPLPIERISLEAGYKRVLAEKIVSSFDFPSHPTSSMDGYAVRSDDVRSASSDKPSRLEIIEDIPAGKPPLKPLRNGQCARIMTGAIVPPSADLVIQVEWTNIDKKTATAIGQTVEIYQGAGRGSNIRPIGQDIKSGETLIDAGTDIQPYHLALLATVGYTEILVFRQPKVAILSSGSELVMPGEPLSPGQIYNANSYSLRGLIQKHNCEFVDLGIVPDDPHGILNRFEQAEKEKVDLIVSSAGVSVGEFDYIRPILESHGKLDFWRVNMRPGKPLAYGSFHSIPVIGLPGNPVSAYIDFLVFGVPAIEHLKGNLSYQPHYQSGVLEEPIELDGRESYLRVVSWTDGEVVRCRLTGHQGSGNIYSLVQANALLIVPSGVKSLPAGANVNLWALD